jgi:hypothetical protein
MSSRGTPVRPAEVRPAKVRPIEVRTQLGILASPIVPCLYSLPNDLEVFFVSHSYEMV